MPGRWRLRPRNMPSHAAMRNARFTFGTGKVGDLAGFTSAILLGIALGIAIRSGMRLFALREIDFQARFWSR